MDSFVIRTLTIAGQTIRTAVRPGKPHLAPLLVCNGIGASLELVLPFAKALDPDQGVIAFDVPGVGGSSTPWLPYRFSRLARLVTKMLDYLGIRQVNVIGLSWGGFLAQQFAHDHPERCKRLILAATSCGAAMVPPSLKVLALMASPRRYTDPEYGAKIAPDIYGGRFRHDKALAAAHAAKMQSTGGLGYYYQMATVYWWTSIHWLHRIKQPTLVLAGDDDPLIPLVNMRVLATFIPNARLHVVNDGHLFLLTQSQTLAPMIQAFLAENDANPHQSEQENASTLGATIQPEGFTMKFLVVDRSVPGTAQFTVDTECGKQQDSYRTEREAQARAAWLNDEYERISEVL